MSPEMIESSEKLLSGAEIRRLRAGSYEEHIGEVASVARTLMGGASFRVVATREKDAVLFSDGKFLRLELREDGPTLSELDVEVFDQTSHPNLVLREVDEMVDLFIQGNVKAAVARLQTWAPMVRAAGSPVERLESQLVAPRLWRRWFSSRRDRFVDFLQESGENLEAAQLRPNFAKLYDGPIGAVELAKYEVEVTEGLRTALDRIGKTRDAVGAALRTASDNLTESSGPVFQLFVDFTRDLHSDLCSLHGATSKTIEAVDDVTLRGRLCDTLVEGLRDREAAGRFVVVVTNRLVEAS